MTAPRRGPAGRDLHLGNVSANEPVAGDEVYAVWTGPLVRRKRGTMGLDPAGFDILPNVPGFERDPKTGLFAWIIKREYIARYQLQAFIDGDKAKATADLGKDGWLLEFLASHVHRVPIVTGNNGDVVQSIPDPSTCAVRADASERRLNTGIIVSLPDALRLGYRGVPIGEGGKGTSPANAGNPASTAGQPYSAVRARVVAALESLRPGAKIYSRGSSSDVNVPAPGTTHITDAGSHSIAIRVSEFMVSVDKAASGSKYSLDRMTDPNRFS